MDSLIEIVTRTITNLGNKQSFLEDQRKHYSTLKSHLVTYKPSASQDESQEKGLVLGEIIISSKIYLNIGYEYYVEKSQQEALQFVTDKIRLIEEATLQFKAKTIEANETLKNLKQAQQLEQKEDIQSEAKDPIPTAENDEGLPFMEIREDLDDDGNIVTSTVNPTSAREELLAKPQYSNAIKDSSVGTEPQQRFEEINDDANLQPKLAAPVSPQNHINGDVANNAREKEDLKATEVTQLSPAQDSATIPAIKEVDARNLQVGNNVRHAIDPNDIYTFDDIVQQLEEQDDIEDGDLDDENIQYDFDSYQSKGHSDDDEGENATDYYESDDYEEYEDSSVSSIVPDVARSQFLSQINALRSKKLEQLGPVERTKPILKANKKTDEPTKKKVGFASELDVWEVENVKQETKANTYTGASHPEALAPISALDNEEFDPDLFAKLIGAKDSDEIHEKYEQEKVEEPVKRKPKVSRFKKDVTTSRGSAVTVEDKLDEGPRTGEKSNTVTSDVLERNPTVTGNVHEKPHEVTSNIPGRDSNTTIDIQERESGFPTDIQERKSASISPIHEVTERLAASSLHDNDATRELGGKMKKEQSLFKKNLRSLKRPSSAPARKTPTIFPEAPNPEADPVESESSRPAQFQKPQFDKSDAKAFPAEIAAIVSQSGAEVVQNPNVDFQGLGENMDDMVRAYILGLYNGDVDDPGTVLENLEDFKKYNKEAEDLQGEISTFLSENPGATSQGDVSTTAASDPAGPITTDVVEKEVPTPMDYDGEEMMLDSEALHYDIAVEYQRLRQKMISAQGNIEKSPEELQLEPIDEYGNPIKTSRFKSAKLQFAKP
ncbi:LANO_0B02894g1_1 [Lachancea nothofagi CBS 11611]|uniref:LANO_0B02894g1_1 n=1 Tax=Lachancea nothofagi CBS 11611 TaxID=1266666 RepID=A0A1G4IWL8_9SACH|nr:LANO_0B02894g1_1 [Lachancea nothofagi CBS 11611]